MLHVVYLPISGSYFSRCLFLNGIFKCIMLLWLVRPNPGTLRLLLACSVAGPKVGDYSWHGTTPGPWHRLGSWHVNVFSFLPCQPSSGFWPYPLSPGLTISALVCLDFAFAPTVICNIFLVASSLSRLCTCPNHLNLFSLSNCAKGVHVYLSPVDYISHM